MATLLQDDFNRANSATLLGSPVVGGPYTVRTGVWGINTNEAYLGTPVANAQVTFPAAIDVDVSVKLPLAGSSTTNSGLLIRWIDANNHWALLRSGTNVHALYRCVAGTYTQCSDNTPVVAGDVIGMKAYGDQIAWFVNGGQKGIITDQWALTATATCGLRNGSTGASRWDDLLAQDQLAPLSTWGGAAVMAPINTDPLAGLHTLIPSLYKGRDTALADESEIP